MKVDKIDYLRNFPNPLHIALPNQKTKNFELETVKQPFIGFLKAEKRLREFPLVLNQHLNNYKFGEVDETYSISYLEIIEINDNKEVTFINAIKESTSKEVLLMHHETKSSTFYKDKKSYLHEFKFEKFRLKKLLEKDIQKKDVFYLYKNYSNSHLILVDLYNIDENMISVFCSNNENEIFLVPLDLLIKIK